MTYCFCSSRCLPARLAWVSPPAAVKSAKLMISARMKPFWMSVWIVPPASQAVVPLRIGHARFSLPPTVRNEM